MKVPKEFEGKWVGLQLARPVYMFEYAAHVKYEGKESLVPQPIVKPGGVRDGGKPDPEQPPTVATTDVILSALVVAVGEDTITLGLFDPDQHGDIGSRMHKTLPTALILSIDEVAGFEVEMPTAAPRRRAAAPAGKLIL